MKLSHKLATAIASQHTTSVDFIEDEEILGEFKLSPTKDLAYFTFNMCHSLPNINNNDRCWTLPTLVRSHQSAMHQLIDDNHELIEHGDFEDRMVGHIIGTKILLPEELEGKNIDELPVIPDKQIAMMGIGCLFKRLDGVESMISNHNNGISIQSVSMECWSIVGENAIFWNDQFIPFSKAPAELLACVHDAGCDSFDGHRVAVAIGGENGQCEFNGLGVVRNPADRDANILQMVASSMSPHSPICFNSATKGEMMDEKLKELKAMLAKLVSANDAKDKSDADNVMAAVAGLEAKIKELEANKAAESQEDVIANVITSKVEAGDLIAKEDHEKAVSEALVKQKEEFEAAQVAETAKAEKMAERTAMLETAGIITKADDEKGKEARQNILNEFNDLATDEEGDKRFDRMLSIWQGLLTAKATTASTASDKHDPVVPPAGGGDDNDKPEKLAHVV